MASWIVAAGLAAGLLGQAEAGNLPADEAIRRAIAELGDERFSVREAASRFLWSQGEAAEPALREALESDDAEVAYRARRILNDFRFGIFPGLPDETLATIRLFRVGDHGQRAAALEKLMDQGQVPTLRRLVRLEPVPDVRRQFYSKLLQTLPAEPPPDQADRLALLLELLAEELDKDVRAQLLGELLSRPQAVEALAKSGRIDAVLDLARDHLDDRARQAILLRLFQSREAVEALVGEGGVDRIVALADVQADPSARGRLLAALITSAPVQAHLGEEKSVGLAVELVRRQKDAVARGEYLKSLLSSSLGYKMLRDPDARKLVWSLVKAASDEEAAGGSDWQVEVMLHFFSSSTPEGLLPEAEDSQLLVRLVRGSPAGESRTRLLERLASDSRITKVLIRHGQLEGLLGVIGELPPSTRGLLRGRLAMLPEASQALATAGRLDLLVSLAEKEPDADARAAYLCGGLFRNSHALDELIKGGQYDALQRMVSGEEDPVRRAMLRGEFVGSGPVVKAIDEKGRLETLLDFARNESDPEARRQYLERLFTHEEPVSLLIERGHDDALLALTRDEDEARQADLRRRLFTSSSMMDRLVNTGRAAMLLEPAEKTADEEQRFVYLSRLCSRQQAVSALVDEGRFEQIVALIGGEKKDASRAMVLRNVFSSPWVLEHFARRDALGEFFRLLEAQWIDARLPILENLLASSSLSRIIEHDGLDEYLDAIKRQPQAEWRGRTLGRVMASSQVVGHLKSEGRLGLLSQIAEHLDDEQARRPFLESLLFDSTALGAWIEGGSFDALYALASGLSDGRARARLLVLLLTNPRAPELVSGRDRLALVLKLANDEGDEEARRTCLETLFSSQSALEQLLRRGHFEELLALASAQGDSARRARLLSRLLGDSRMMGLLAGDNRLGLVVQRAAGEEDAETRRILLSAMARNAAAVASLEKSGRLDELIRLCRADADAGERRRLLAELMSTPEALQHLARNGSLRPFVGEVLDDPDQNVRARHLENWLRSADVVDVFVEQGLLDRLQEAVNEDEDPRRRLHNLVCLLTAPNAAEELSAEKGLDSLRQALAEVTKRDRGAQGSPFAANSDQLVQTVLSRPAALKTLLEGGLHDSLLEWIQSQPKGRARAQARELFLFSPATIGHLAAERWLDQYRKLLADQPDPRLQSPVISRLVSSEEALRLLCRANLAGELLALVEAQPEPDRGRSALNLLARKSCLGVFVENGQGDSLLRLIDSLPEERRSYYLTPLLYGPSGIVAHHLGRGEYAEAEAVLEKNAEDDLGRLHLAACLLVSGRINERIAAERKRLARRPDAPPDDYRLLTYLLRAGGDLAGACAAAERTQDPGLRLAMLAEAGRWSEAAELQAAQPCPLPIPVSSRPAQNEAYPRIEQFSLAAAYARLAGQEAGCKSALGEIRNLCESQPGDVKLHWFAVEALLLNDRVEEGLKLLAGTYPARAFDLFVHRREYHEAFELAGWREGVTPDRNWLMLLPTGRNAEAERLFGRVDLAIRLARTLQMLGREEEADAIMEVVEDYVADETRQAPRQPSLLEAWQGLCLGLVAMGHEESAWQAALGRANGESSGIHPPPLVYRLYDERREEARGWWYVFREQYPSEPTATTFARVHRMLNPPADEDGDALAKLVEQAPRRIALSFSHQREAVLTAVGEACLGRGRLELACRVLEPHRDASPAAAFLLGDALRRSEKWLEAAAAYQAAWDLDHERPEALYLAGDALERAGRHEEGARQKHRADLVALESRTRVDMALSLLRHELEEDADRQFQLVLKTSPPAYWQWHEAARRIGDRLEREDPALAADWLEQAILDDLRTQFYLLEDTSYLGNRAQIHRLRAVEAVGRGDFDAAGQAVEMALAASPADADLAEALVPLLDKAGRTQQADELLDALAGRYKACLADHPRSAALNNDLAWLLACSGRRLDEALAHAERAVELAPETAAYLDTLAETCFRRGDRDAAVRFARRAVKLRPHDAAARRRLEQFRGGESP